MSSTTLDTQLAPPTFGSFPSARRTWSLRTSFFAVAATQTLLLAASNFPTPLFPVYARHYGFGSGTVTLLFGVYVLALIPSMLTLGRLTDRLGRRPVLATGIALTAISSLAFASARSVGWLFAGEIIYGIAGGMVMSAASVAIRELHPKQSSDGGALAATLAAAIGLALGPLVSGVLATVTPWPTVSPYVLDIVVAAILFVVLLRIPETKPVHGSAAFVTKRVPLLHVPSEIRPMFLATALAAATGWMATGWVFGLSPSFLHTELGVHITQPIVAGLFAALMVASNGASQLAFRRRHSSGALHTALVVLVSGMALMVGSTLVDSLTVALVGSVVTGLGSGLVQMSTMATILRIAPAHARGGVMSAFLSVCYLALSLPVVIAGVVADRLGLGVVSAWYVVAFAVLVASAMVAARRAVRMAMVS
ncbi:MAG: putative major facilitator superfamily transporter [Ilumatobacteraceae bacterium]|nr:putative major facilitator superfamily transporter [Ilumatobacteraceae bacterium]